MRFSGWPFALVVFLSGTGCGEGGALSGAPASTPSDIDALRGACARARPDWTSYTEDLKAALGATPVAQWEGLPESVARDGGTLFITFSLDAPWDGYDFGLPVLLRDPFGEVRLPAAFTAGPSKGVYRYELSGIDPRTPVPWVEVKFPREQTRRLVLDANGVWRRTE